MIQLIRLAHNKIKIVFDDFLLDKLMKENKQFLKYIKNPDENKQDCPFHRDEYLVIEIIALGHVQFLRHMLNN